MSIIVACNNSSMTCIIDKSDSPPLTSTRLHLGSVVTPYIIEVVLTSILNDFNGVLIDHIGTIDEVFHNFSVERGTFELRQITLILIVCDQDGVEEGIVYQVQFKAWMLSKWNLLDNLRRHI